jgi:anti-sigma-K factor RskA
MPPPDDDMVAFAGEYVLGTLTAPERAEAETRIVRESAFASVVLAWERHFAPFALAAVPLQPPAHLRRRILEAIGAGEAAGGNVVQLRRQLNVWRGLTVGAAALAAALAAVLLVRPPEPPLPAGGKYVAVLQPEGPGPAFVATIDLASGTISALRIGAEPQAGKSYELWAVGGGRDRPQSLGLVDASLRIPADRLGRVDPGTLAETVFAVSLEPEGGSPTGQPTGPVLYTGKLVATE